MAAFLILFSFSMNGIFDRMLYDYYENTDHEYIGYCEYAGECKVLPGQDKVIELPSALLNDEDVALIGISQYNELHRLYNSKGKDISSKLEEGIVITESLRVLNGIDIGDLVSVEIGEKSEEYEVVAISYEYSGEKAYILITDLSMLLTDTDDYYNAVYSRFELSEEDYMLVLGIQDIIDQADKMQGFFILVNNNNVVSST